MMLPRTFQNPRRLAFYATHMTSLKVVAEYYIASPDLYSDLNVTNEAEDKETDVYADKDDTGTYSTRSGSSAVSSDNPASDSNVSLSELRGSQHNSVQSTHPGPAAVSLQQSDLTNSPLLRHRRRRDNTKNIRCKRLRIPSPTGPASTTSPVPVTLESNDLEHTQSVAQLTATAKEREIRDIDHEMADNGGSDDSNDDDYENINNAKTSEIRHPPHSRKRVMRAKDTEHNDVETTSTHSLNVSCQATTARRALSERIKGPKRK
jgi:hypothetical protein